VSEPEKVEPAIAVYLTCAVCDAPLVYSVYTQARMGHVPLGVQPCSRCIADAWNDNIAKRFASFLVQEGNP